MSNMQVKRNLLLKDWTNIFKMVVLTFDIFEGIQDPLNYLLLLSKKNSIVDVTQGPTLTLKQLPRGTCSL